MRVQARKAAFFVFLLFLVGEGRDGGQWNSFKNRS